MRNFAIAIIVGSLCAAPALAQAPAPQVPGATMQAPKQAPKIQRIAVVEVTTLSKTSQKQVQALASKREQRDWLRLRGSVEATPGAKAALQKNGFEIAHVVAASLQQDGTLVLVVAKG